VSFWAIDLDSLDGSMREVRGPFESRKSAEEFIRRDFADWWAISEIPLSERDDECAGKWLIVQQVAEVRPVGRASLKVQLVEEAK